MKKLILTFLLCLIINNYTYAKSSKRMQWEGKCISDILFDENFTYENFSSYDEATQSAMMAPSYELCKCMYSEMKKHKFVIKSITEMPPMIMQICGQRTITKALQNLKY